MVYSSRENFTATMLGGGGSGLEYGGDSRMSALVDETVVSDWQISSGQLPPAPVWGSSGPPIPPVVAPPVVNSPNLDDLTEEQVGNGLHSRNWKKKKKRSDLVCPLWKQQVGAVFAGFYYCFFFSFNSFWMALGPGVILRRTLRAAFGEASLFSDLFLFFLLRWARLLECGVCTAMECGRVVSTQGIP